MKMKNINKNPLFKAIFAIALISIATFGFNSTVFASYDDYSSGGWDNYSFDYYQPTYDYSYDYYTPSYDYSYDYYTPSYDYSYDYYTPSYDYSYDYYTPSYDYEYDYYTPSYSYTPYTYTPSNYSTPQYYSTPSYVGSTYTPYIPTYNTPSYTPYTPPVYVPTTSSNTGVNNNHNSSNSNSSANASSSNTNNNVNNNNNDINNVNNNNINIVVGTPITSTTNQPQNQTLDGSCYISPSNVSVNQDITFTANATGGTGNYSYSWNGSDGISSGSRTFTGRFSNPGYKTATVVITSGNQSISRSCSVSVDQNYNYYNNMNAYCIANPTSANVGQTIVWTAYVTGGNSSYYTYSWYGTDGLSYGNANSIQKSYQTAGYKTATVTVYGNNNQSVSATCSTNITGYVAPANVTVIRQPNTPAPSSGVYLSQVPQTGIDANMKIALFMIGLIIWSAFVGYVIISRKKNKLAFANGTSPRSIAEKIKAFKLENMRKQGLIK